MDESEFLSKISFVYNTAYNSSASPRQFILFGSSVLALQKLLSVSEVGDIDLLVTSYDALGRFADAMRTQGCRDVETELRTYDLQVVGEDGTYIKNNPRRSELIGFKGVSAHVRPVKLLRVDYIEAINLWKRFPSAIPKKYVQRLRIIESRL